MKSIIILFSFLLILPVWAKDIEKVKINYKIQLQREGIHIHNLNVSQIDLFSDTAPYLANWIVGVFSDSDKDIYKINYLLKYENYNVVRDCYLMKSKNFKYMTEHKCKEYRMNHYKKDLSLYSSILSKFARHIERELSMTDTEDQRYEELTEILNETASKIQDISAKEFDWFYKRNLKSANPCEIATKEVEKKNDSVVSYSAVHESQLSIESYSYWGEEESKKRIRISKMLLDIKLEAKDFAVQVQEFACQNL